MKSKSTFSEDLDLRQRWPLYLFSFLCGIFFDSLGEGLLVTVLAVFAWFGIEALADYGQPGDN